MNNLHLLQQTALFRGMSEEEVHCCLKMLHAQEKEYRKENIILHAGGTTDRMGLVLSGGVTIENIDMWGNRSILNSIGEGQFFAETYAMLPGEIMPVDVRASKDSRILFLTIGDMFKPGQGFNRKSLRTDSEKSSLTTAEREYSWKEKLTKNLLFITAHKNLALSGRIFHTSPKSCRGRLLSYLNTVSLQKQSASFDIPFDRQQLADYLNLERTSLSKEIGRMQREGILRCKKNHFTLLTELPVD